MIERLKKLTNININYVHTEDIKKSCLNYNAKQEKFLLKDSLNYGRNYDRKYVTLLDQEQKFNLLEFVQKDDLNISILFKTKKAKEIILFIKDSLNNVKSEEYFSNEVIENYDLRDLDKLKDREVHSFINYYNHSFIKLWNKEFVMYFTITNGNTMKYIYILKKNDSMSFEEICYNKNFIGNFNKGLGLGDIYTSKFFENHEILKLFYNDQIYNEFLLQPEMPNIYNNYQSDRYNDLRSKMQGSDTEEIDLIPTLKKEISNMRHINYNNNLCRVNTVDSNLSKVDNTTNYYDNLHNIDIIITLNNKLN